MHHVAGKRGVWPRHLVSLLPAVADAELIRPRHRRRRGTRTVTYKNATQTHRPNNYANECAGAKIRNASTRPYLLGPPCCMQSRHHARLLTRSRFAGRAPVVAREASATTQCRRASLWQQGGQTALPKVWHPRRQAMPAIRAKHALDHSVQ
ncbi:hypothetical protein TRVL_10392 [Trypanosoma vivax]|nr:hypothetical protein TRVL_10392 [Trypanosoma vivax]